jgi:hypothetical protein
MWSLAFTRRLSLSHINQAVVAVDTVTQSIGGQTKQVGRVADALLIIYAVIFVAILAAGAWYLL